MLKPSPAMEPTPELKSEDSPPPTRRIRMPSQRVRDILEGRTHLPPGVQTPTTSTPVKELEGEGEAGLVDLLEDEDFLLGYAMVAETSDSEALEPRSLAQPKRRPGGRKQLRKS